MSNMNGESNLISKPRTQLIAFDREKKIRYFGPCSNVEINAADRCLILTTNSTVKNLKEVASTFNRIFVQKENALCVIDEGITNKNFMVIFSSKELCDQIFVAINKAKYPSITPPPKNDPSTEDYFFKNNFYVPILKEIKRQIPGFKEIKTTILDLINSFEADKRQIYMNMVFEILVFSGVSADENEIGGVQDYVSSNSHRTQNDRLNSTNQSLNDTTNSGYGSRKRPRISYAEIDSFESDEMDSLTSLAAQKSRHSISNTSTNENQACPKTQNASNIITADYEFVERLSQGSVRKRLLIFTSEEKDKCYEFYYSTKQEWQTCKNCCHKNCRTYVRIVSAKNGKIEFYYGTQKHVCEPVQFVPENYVVNENMNLDIIEMDKEKLCGGRKSGVKKLIKTSHFQFVDQIYKSKIVPKLFVFDEKDRSLCHQYSRYIESKQQYRCLDCVKNHHRNVYATFIKSEDNGNNGDIVELGKSEHLCQPKKFP